MPRNRQIYPIHGAFIGPAPSTGFHSINNDTTLSNNGQYNLVFQLHRVQTAEYQTNFERIDLKELGWRGTVSRPIYNHPTANVGFSYLQHGVINELRMGFCANYSDTGSSTPFYANNFQVGVLSGFLSRSTEPTNNTLRWPLAYRDKRNLFFAVGSGQNDIRNFNSTDTNKASQMGVIGFGNCYLTSYRATASVGNLPVVSVEYVAENMQVTASGTGVPVPALDSVSGKINPNVLFALPNTFVGPNYVSVIRPGDITVSISSSAADTGLLALIPTGVTRAANAQIPDITADLQDVKIQSYNLTLNLPRTPMYSAGHVLPLDRRIDHPVYANLSVDTVVGDDITGSLEYLLAKDDDYNVTIRLQNPQSAPFRGTAVQYDLRKAKLGSFGSQMSIGPNRRYSITFQTEITPDDFSKGLFISGLLNMSDGSTTQPGNYLLKEDGSKLLQENLDGILLTSAVLH